jgi:transglutaminase-like putative cysteine protease
VRLLIQHHSRYEYGQPAALGPHTIRLRPTSHAKAKVETYALRVEPECKLRWQQDPANNYVARLTFPPLGRTLALDLRVELAVDVRPNNPFDFFVDPLAKEVPFAYPSAIASDLSPYLDTTDPAFAGGPLLKAFLDDQPREGPTVDLIVALCAAANRRLRYVIREETGVWTPEQTLTEGRGSCRDSAVLLVAMLRARGLASSAATWCS